MYLRELQALIDKNVSVATVTIIEEKGSSPRGIGSNMIVTAEGLVTGSIGGGAIEFKAIKDAIDAIKNKKSCTINYPLEKLDMTCGGEVTIFIQVYPRKKEVLIVGGGHICRALLPLFNTLDYKTVVIDQREAIFDDNVFSNSRCISSDILEGLASINYHKDLYIVIVTHGHEFDEATLGYVITKSHAYVGMIGSKNKIKHCYENLINKGFNKNLLNDVYAPIGLTLGGETPEDIALSIVSEIHAISNKQKIDHYRNII